MSSEQLVLIVDGDPKEQRVLTVSLKNAGLQVVSASSGYEALERMEQPDSRIGVAVIELDLPQMSGFELCERIRENPRMDSINLVALTNSQDLSTKLRAYEIGFDELLTKPVFIKEIATRVEMMLQRRALSLLAEAQAKQLEGELSDISSMDLLLAVSEGRKTGYATIIASDDAGEGRIFFREGRVTDAESARLRGEPALFRVLRWSEGSYQLKYLDELNRRQRIRRHTDVLLAEAIERNESWRALCAQLPPLSSVYDVDMQRLAKVVSGMPPEVQAVTRLFDGVRTLEEVVQSAAMGDLEALMVVERFLSQDLLFLTDDEVEEEDDEIEAAGSEALHSWLSGIRPIPEEMTTTTPEPIRAVHAEPLEGRSEQRSRRDLERARIEQERERLEGDQEQVLARIARAEAEAARAQVDRVRAEMAKRRTDALTEAGLELREEDLEPVPDTHRRPTSPSGESPIPEPLRSGQDIDAVSPRKGNGAYDEPASASYDARESRLIEQARQDHQWVASALAGTGMIETSTPAPRHDTQPDLEPPAPEPTEPAVARAPKHVEPMPSAELDMNFSDDGDDEDIYRPVQQVKVVRHARLKSLTELESVKREPRAVSSGAAPAPLGPSHLRSSDLYERLLEESREEARKAEPAPAVERSEAKPAAARTAPGLSSPALAAAKPAPRQREDTPTPREPIARATPGQPSAEDHEKVDAMLSVDAVGPTEELDKGHVQDIASRPAEPEVEPAGPPSDIYDVDLEFFDDPTFHGPKNANARRAMTIIIALLFIGIIIAFIVLADRESQPLESDSDSGAEATTPAETTALPPTTAPPPTTAAATGGPEEPLFREGELEAESDAQNIVDDVVNRAESIASDIAARGELTGDPTAPPETTPEDVAAANVDPTPPEDPPKKEEPRMEEPKKEEPRKVVVKKEDPPKKEEPKKEEPKKVTVKKSSGGGADALVKEGDKLLKKRKYNDAIAKYEAALDEEPGNRKAHYGLGTAYSKTRKNAKAVKHLEKVRGSYKKDADFWTNLGNAYAQLKKKNEARQAYEKAIALYGADSAKGKAIKKYMESRLK